MDGAAARTREEFVHGRPFEQADRPGWAVDIGGIDHQHRVRRLDIGQQTEAQGTGVDEIRGVGAEHRAQPLDDLYPGAVVAQQHIAEPQDQGGGASSHARPAERLRAVSVQAMTPPAALALRCFGSEHSRRCKVCAVAYILCRRRGLRIVPCTSCPSASRSCRRSLTSPVIAVRMPSSASSSRSVRSRASNRRCSPRRLRSRAPAAARRSRAVDRNDRGDGQLLELRRAIASRAQPPGLRRLRRISHPDRGGRRIAPAPRRIAGAGGAAGVGRLTRCRARIDHVRDLRLQRDPRQCASARRCRRGPRHGGRRAAGSARGQ